MTMIMIMIVIVTISVSIAARRQAAALAPSEDPANAGAANLRTKILDFRGFDSSIILIAREGILRPIGNIPES